MVDHIRNPLAHRELTGQIISAFYDVYNGMVRGLLESCYQNALYVELQKRGIDVEREVSFDVRYKGHVVGQYRVDLLVERRVIVECKTADSLRSHDEPQLLHYLKATGAELGLLMYFGSKPLFRRLIHTPQSAVSPTLQMEKPPLTSLTPAPTE